MENSHKIQGWKIHHQERLLFRAKSGSPTIHLKFFHYPNYRQSVHIHKSPSDCKVKIKGNNSFFIFQQKVHTKGTISLDRIVSVFPTVSFGGFEDNWGKISDIPLIHKSKYRESSKYWPIKSPTILNMSEQEWFEGDDLSLWVKSAFRYIRGKIKHRERQEERLGAHQAFLAGIGDCDEFTDLCVTLARMRGIPCRRLTGYYIANKGNFVEPHAWGEIFSPKESWIPVDVALNKIGHHLNYIILKTEEFNPSLSDYRIQTKHNTRVQYHWEKPDPVVTPIFEE